MKPFIPYIEFRDIPGFPGYIISNTGKIYSMFSNKYLSSFIDNLGYEQVILYKDKKRCYKRIHRLMYETWFKPDSDKTLINHINGNKLDNRLINLELVTNSENVVHAYNMGLYESKPIKILAIHKKTNENLIFNSIRECATVLNINRKTLSSILKNNKVNNYDYDFIIL